MALLACTLAAAAWSLAQDASASPPDCGYERPGPDTAVDAPPCKGLDACLSALVAAAEPGPGISRKEDAASKAVLAFGEAAVPALLPLLKDANPEVRALASYTLRDAPVTEEHLDALIASRLKGDGWIPPAIARVGTRPAIEFLVSELRKEPENGTQLTWAFEVLGAKGVPYLVELYDCRSLCDEKLLAVGAYIFSELGDTAKDAIEPLLEIAEDARRDQTGRRGAMRALGSIGPAAAPVVARLKAIAARDPASFEEAVTQAMVHMGGAAAIEGREAEARAQERCRTKGTPEAVRSRAALDALGRRIGTLESADDLRQASADLRSLLGSRCFRLAAEQGDPPAFTHQLSLKTWWETGGQAWLASYIDRPRFGRVDDPREHVVFPPRPRAVLTLETAPGHMLAPLLCSLADEGCGRETRGWAVRAQDAFAAVAVQDRARRDDAFPVSSQALAARCQALVRRNEARGGYREWMECLAEHRVSGWALPLGHFRAPDRGWLVIRGRRGHYEFCDQLGVYDVATGAAYVAKSCTGLHLRPDGSVGGWSSAQTQLGWSWLTADGQILASGTLTWPSSYSAPEAHAADLLRIAELGLRSECPPAKLPTFEARGPGSGVSARDARPEELAALQGELATRLREYASSAACVSPGRE